MTTMDASTRLSPAELRLSALGRPNHVGFAHRLPWSLSETRRRRVASVPPRSESGSTAWWTLTRIWHVRLRAMGLLMVARIAGGPRTATTLARAAAIAARLDDAELIERVERLRAKLRA